MIARASSHTPREAHSRAQIDMEIPIPLGGMRRPLNVLGRVASALALAAVSSTTPAVNVDPRGLGQVLLYPYYTVQEPVPGSAYASLLTVANTTPSVKVVRVRFLEGRHSREVLDFNLFLSPRDVWTAAVLPAGAGAGVATFDRSCTVPVVSNNPSALTAFTNAGYVGDGAGDGLERTREGYVEIIEMGVPTDATLIKSVYHINGVPPCTGLANLTTGIAMAPPQGGLYGGMTLINVLAGTDYTAEAVALDAFRTTGRYELPGSVKPDLTDVDPPIASLSSGSIYPGGTVRSTGWNQPVDAVSAVLMQTNVYNEFVLDPGTKSGTDWVVTMPTKRYYYDGPSVKYLFQRHFTASGACDEILLEIYDRELAHLPLIDPWGRPPPPPNTVCWEANVLSFNQTTTLGSKNTSSRNVATVYSNGAAILQFPRKTGESGVPAHALVSQSTVQTSLAGATSAGVATYLGLPVIGFAVQSFTNGTLIDGTGQRVQSTYGGNFAHRGKTTILFTPDAGGAQ